MKSKNSEKKAKENLFETIHYGGTDYPALQARGNAAKFARPFFDEMVPEGSRGYDVGFGRPEWAIREDAVMVGDGGEFHALNLPPMEPTADYLFSSHCLEHIPAPVPKVLDYWRSMVRPGGLVFLYLPSMDHQRYWAYGNDKHIHYINESVIEGYCRDRELRACITPGCDLNSSFYCVILVQ